VKCGQGTGASGAESEEKSDFANLASVSSAFLVTLDVSEEMVCAVTVLSAVVTISS
jgi:hypothetical protein